MFSKFFRARAPVGKDSGRHKSADDTVAVSGNFYAFHTTPANEFSASETGRWAAIKLLGVNQRMVVMAVLDGIWSALPSFKEVKVRPILREHRFAWTGQHAVFGVNIDWWSPSGLSEMTFLGTASLSSEEAAVAKQTMAFAPGSRMSTMHAADRAAEGEWRWAHDRAAFSEENGRKQEKLAQEQAAQEERYRTRLSKLTWDQLLAETPFQRWSPSPPFPPEEFVVGARQVVREACQKLEALGSKPRKADVRAVLKDCVDWFNDADERAGGVIETEEREDICAVLEELAYVARQKGLMEEIDTWRSW